MAGLIGLNNEEETVYQKSSTSPERDATSEDMAPPASKRKQGKNTLRRLFAKGRGA